MSGQIKNPIDESFRKFSSTASGKAGMLLTLLSKPAFLVSLVCLDKYMKLLLAPTKSLQGSDLEILSAFNMMHDVIKVTLL